MLQEDVLTLYVIYKENYEQVFYPLTSIKIPNDFDVFWNKFQSICTSLGLEAKTLLGKWSCCRLAYERIVNMTKNVNIEQKEKKVEKPRSPKKGEKVYVISFFSVSFPLTISKDAKDNVVISRDAGKNPLNYIEVKQGVGEFRTDDGYTLVQYKQGPLFVKELGKDSSSLWRLKVTGKDDKGRNIYEISNIDNGLLLSKQGDNIILVRQPEYGASWLILNNSKWL
jgi:hypothetical protein